MEMKIDRGNVEYKGLGGRRKRIRFVKVWNC